MAQRCGPERRHVENGGIAGLTKAAAAVLPCPPHPPSKPSGAVRASLGEAYSEAQSCGADLVAMCHTLDDHTEMVLLRLARGGGLGAITPPCRPCRATAGPPSSRRGGTGFGPTCAPKGVPGREDASNREGFTARNLIRNLLGPPPWTPISGRPTSRPENWRRGAMPRCAPGARSAGTAPCGTLDPGASWS